MNFRALLAALLLYPFALMAQDIPMNPGQWEMKMTMQMSMMPQPQVKVTSKCIEESELNLESFQMAGDSECSQADTELVGNTVRGSITCPGPTSDMTGNWEFTVDGDSLVGHGIMNTDMGGKPMEIKLAWEGKRTGDCD